MAIKIDEREHRGTAVLVLTGRMTTNECHGALTAVIRSLVERGRKQIVIDLEAVPFIDSAGLGELVSSYASVQRIGGSLKLTNVNRKIATTLETARLTQVLQVTDLPAHLVPRG
jgi:anti-sigma B factor antagonist